MPSTAGFKRTNLTMQTAFQTGSPSLTALTQCLPLNDRWNWQGFLEAPGEAETSRCPRPARSGSAAGDVCTADGATGTGASATALRAPLRAVDALWGHCYTTPHCDNAGESLGVDDTEAAMVIACAVVKYQALSAGGARDMVSAGKSGTLRRPRISRRGHDIGGGCPPQGCADHG
jgi:hypothetical protein